MENTVIIIIIIKTEIVIKLIEFNFIEYIH